MREHGAVPATIAILGGEVRIGLDEDALEALWRHGDVAKCGVRDLAPVLARGGDGATTVAATRIWPSAPGSGCSPPAGSAACIAARATRSTSRRTWARWRGVGICVVCAGVKSILDIPATLERLETLNVTVLGYRHGHVPGLLPDASGCRCTWRVDSPEEVAAVLRARGRSARPAPWSWPTRSTSRWTPNSTTACSARGCGGG